MNVKQIVQTQVNELVVAIAELYNPLMDDEATDEEFEIVAEAVTIERDQLIDNLLTLVEVIVEDTLEEAKRAEIKKAVRLRKILPPDIEVPERAPEAPVAPPAAQAGAVMERVQSLPRDVIGPTMALDLPDNLMEAAREAIVDDSLIPISGSSELFMDDVTTNDDYTHNLGMTLAEKSRKDHGLPIKLHRPTIHMGLPDRPVVALSEPVKVEEPAPTNFTLEEIEEEARGK